MFGKKLTPKMQSVQVPILHRSNTIHFRRPKDSETFLSQRRASRKNHAVLQGDFTIRPISGARGHHISRVHENGATAVGFTRARQRSRQ